MGFEDCYISLFLNEDMKGMPIIECSVVSFFATNFERVDVPILPKHIW